MLYLGKNAVVPAITVSGGEVTSVITATNNTGSAISEGDKVWINQENGENKLVNCYTDTPNYIVDGALTFDSGGKVVSGFSTLSELQLLDRKKYQSNGINSMEMIFKIHTPTEGNWTDNGRIINSRADYDDFSLDINQNRPRFCFINTDYSNNKTVQVAPANMASDTDYWIKVTYDGTNLYGYYSLDGENYTLQETIARSSNDLYLNSSYGYSIGNRNLNNGDNQPWCVWNGSIDLFKSYIKINGVYWWTPYATNITSATQTGTAVENISSGSTGLVNVGAVIEPTGSITITENGTHNVADYAEAIVNVPVPVVDKYKVGDRVNDDSNNPVGTVSSIFTDGNGDRYAVVCLDAVNRNNDTYYLYDGGTVTGLPIYGKSTWGPWNATETATFNTQKILDYCTSNNTTSSSCTHCRSKSFTIDGVTYYGQLPNVIEVMEIMKNFQLINNQDPTASTSYTTNFSTGRNIWSSTQYDQSSSSSIRAFYGYSGGAIQDSMKNSGSKFAVPVLEIPLED